MRSDIRAASPILGYTESSVGGRPRGLLAVALPLATLLFGSAIVVHAEPQAVEARVLRVIDGDTIQVRIGNVVELVRYIGINTPEIHHPTRGREPYGEAAAAANRALVEGQTVTLAFDAQPRDRYFRLLAYVWVGDRLVNAELVKQGYAEAATFPPNVRYAEYFRQLERVAREGRQGLWGDSEAVQHHRPAPGSQEAAAKAPVAESRPAAAGSSSPALTPLASGPSSSPRSGERVNVRGYTRSDGTYVAPYTRSAPTRRR